MWRTTLLILLLVASPAGIQIDWNDLTGVPPAVVGPGTSFAATL